MNGLERALIIENGVTYVVEYDQEGQVKAKYEATLITNQPKKRTYYKKGTFFIMNIAFNEFISKKYHDYNKLTFGVINELFQKIEFNNRIEAFRQRDLAEKLKTSQSNVSRSLKALIDDNIIRREGVYYYFTEQFIKFAEDTRGKKK